MSIVVSVEGFLIGNNEGKCENCYYIGGENEGLGRNLGNIRKVDNKDSVDSIKTSIVAGKI